MKKENLGSMLWWTFLTFFAANSYVLIRENLWYIVPAGLALLAAHLLPGRRLLTFDRLVICGHGIELLIVFFISVTAALPAQLAYVWHLLPENFFVQLLSDNAWDVILTRNVLDVTLTLIIYLYAEVTIFWHGIFCVYCTSVQLGIRYRMWGLFCALVPVLNLFMLIQILRIAQREIETETIKNELNKSRHEDRICETKYPILMVHGFFFRDSKLINYWGRIPGELEKNGAVLFYGEHQSAAPIAVSAEELAERIGDILRKTGAKKVNIIAHSKGGLDCRYALEHLGVAPYVASLTTVNTPHRGCVYADNLLEKISPDIQEKVGLVSNILYKRLGDHQPDFMEAARDLTASSCKQFDDMPVPEGVYCQSVGSVLEKALRGSFPMNATYLFVKRFDGPNDGLVAESSFSWGEKYTLITTKSRRGISHTDMMDLNRENLPDFDVREFYVQLVADLKNRGL